MYIYIDTLYSNKNSIAMLDMKNRRSLVIERSCGLTEEINMSDRSVASLVIHYCSMVHCCDSDGLKLGPSNIHGPL